MCKKANSFMQKRLLKFGAAFKNSIIKDNYSLIRDNF